MVRTPWAVRGSLGVRALLATSLFAGLLLIPAQARAGDAEQASRHRLLAAVGTGSVVMTRSDYAWRFANALALRALYGYQVARPVEVGGGVTLFDVEDVGRIFAPHLTLRLFHRASPQAGLTEFGFSVHLGKTFARYYDATWSGLFLALAPDLRLPLTRTIGVQVSAEVANVTEGTDASGYDETAHHQPAIAFHLWLGVFAMP